ncbi:DNA primase [Streptomyces sp. NPDC020898]|uniref:DNA primase n=1 Tax=Streptomyces sp. NPDC020898 TaxID=3365101 RepID=UPI0037A5D826
MNRVGLGLAVGAGYVLGRTKKLKLAFAVGTLVAGKRMQLSPKALTDLVSSQLRDNPQFKEIGDQLREDLRGVGKAASGAMVERQIEALADRLHGRTSEVRDQLAGVVPDPTALGRDRGRDDYEDEYEDEDGDAYEEAADEEPRAERNERSGGPAKKKTAKKTAVRTAPAKKAAAKKTSAPDRSSARKTTAKKTAAARDAGRGARARLPKEGGGR